MFRKTNPQRELFTVETNIPGGARVRLKESWAEFFRDEILSVLLESESNFADLYGITGRPNFSVARMLGICFLQELNKMADQEALDALTFDIRWQHALDITAKETYLSRRSLVEFRSRLVAVDPEMKRMRKVFERIGDGAINKIDISDKEQRMDSTHIQSNIKAKGRLGLFFDVMELFLKSLKEEDYASAPESIRNRHEKETHGWFGLKDAERKTKTVELAKEIHQLLELFANNERVVDSEEYQLLVRLFREQCEVKEVTSAKDTDKKPPVDSNSNVDEDETEKVVIEIKKKPEGDTLQSAFDTDASYGHKGQGYSVHITETCNNGEKPEIILDFEVHGAARSDVGKATDSVERLDKAARKPEKLYADGGYPTVESAYQLKEENGVELVAPVNRGPMDEAVMGRERFEFNADGHVTKCPEGHAPIKHKMLSNNSTTHSLHAIFNGDLCRACSKLDTCPVRAPNHRNKGVKPRETIGNFRLEITPGLRLRDEMLAKQKTIEWKDKYKIRSGVEATMSELKRAHGLGKLRVRGLARVHFAVVCKVVACNIKRWAAWQAKRSKTRDGVTDGGSGADGGGINGGENHPDRDPSYISSLVKAASILLFRKLSIFPNAA
jgi:Transposase DDE domain/Transposase domain (DUF772)